MFAWWLEFRLFEEWKIGILKLSFENNSFCFSKYHAIGNPVFSARNLKGRKADYVADPFLVFKEGVFYLFFEIFENNKGIIGYAESRDCKRWEYKKIVLDEPFHLSYPFIFEVFGRYYMLPEAGQSKSVRLYQAIDFPENWQFVRTLVTGKEFTDPTLFSCQNKFWLFVSDTSSGNLYLYFADSLESEWQEHPQSPIVSDNKFIARPGGNVVKVGNKLIRIAQDDFKDYGVAVRALEIIKLNVLEYEERELAESPLLSATGKGWNKDGMHQLSVCALNDKEWIAAVDGKSFSKKYRFCLNLPDFLNRILEPMLSKNIPL